MSLSGFRQLTSAHGQAKQGSSAYDFERESMFRELLRLMGVESLTEIVWILFERVS